MDDKKLLFRVICENIVGKGYYLLIVFDNVEDFVKDNDCGLFVEILFLFLNLININILVIMIVKVFV